LVQIPASKGTWVMVVTNRTKKYPRLVRLVSHVVGTRRREEAVTDKSEESRMKAAVVMVEPMVAPSCEMLRMADQLDSKATLEPAKLGAYSSIRPSARKKRLATEQKIKKMDDPGRERLAFIAALAFHDANINSRRLRKNKIERRMNLTIKNGLRIDMVVSV